MGSAVGEDFTVEVAISAEVTLAAITDGTVVVTAGEADVHIAAGIGVVGTAVPIGMGAAGTGTEVARIGGGTILTVTALSTTTTSGLPALNDERRLDDLEQCMYEICVSFKVGYRTQSGRSLHISP
jgi:hypothetical protein